jgi:carbonic anhydrase
MRRTINSFKINNNFSGNLAVFCSDERFIESNLAFLRNSLKIKQSDLFSIPGGVAFIAKNESNLLDRLGILVEAHSITQIILISHSDCGYYKIQANLQMKKY